jgi:predicted AlkP superfamily phosphohydrolase/phosphomutase
MTARRVFMLGLDGVPPETLARFVAEGALPRLQRLLSRATVVDMQPTLPALTAPGWMCMATGAHPTTLGIETILLPGQGDTPADILNGFDGSLVQAETLWECLERQGRRSIVFKYPGSWPPRPGTFTQVDGAGGYADITCRFEVVCSKAYTSEPVKAEQLGSEALFPSGYRDHWRIDTGAEHSRVHVIPRRAVGWRNLPAGYEARFEFALHREYDRVPWLGVACATPLGPHLLLCRSKDAATPLLDLVPGKFSGSLRQRGPRGDFSLRFKLLDLDLEARRLHLYRSEGHSLDGFTQPAALAAELVEKVGPPLEWTGTYDVMNGLIDLETQLEIYTDHTRWMANTIRALCRRQPDWAGFFMQWHVVEYAHHLIGASLHDDHPYHDPALAPQHLAFLRRTYQLVDELLAAVEDVADTNTLIAITSDHGHDLVHSVFYVNELLRKHGFLHVQEQGERTQIDWSRTSAYGLFPGFIYLNLQGRYRLGSLSPERAPEVLAQLCELLRGVVDPRTGRHAVVQVMGRSELAAHGNWGPRTADLFFAMDRGYEVATRVTAVDDGPFFEVTKPLEEVTSGHGSFHPASSSARTLAAFAGAGIREGALARAPGRIIDIAPTICQWLGLEPPRQADGGVLALTHVVEFQGDPLAALVRQRLKPEVTP